jgi:8-oxo-dGTP pyrophosphatase MutT (NUDIX family)
MPDRQPIIHAVSGRQFAASAAALLVFIVDSQERILLLAHPRRQGEWEVVNGALDAGETILQCALRETREEAGAGVQVRPLGLVHAYTFHFDENIPHMITLGYLFAYQGGEIEPGDDMRGSRFRWWRLDELASDEVRLIVPRDQKWLLERAVQLYRLWKDAPVPELQPPLQAHARSKYTLGEPRQGE